ncbi:MAG: tyrosine-protein kinase [Gaiellaceae bacterium]|nr:tyrosine-protein kinase [Gaiellaceae bacterium]
MTEIADQEQWGTGLRRQFDVIRRRKWIVVLVTLAAVAAAALYSYTAKPIYRADTQIVVGQGGTILSTSVLGNATQPLTATMAELLKSNVVLEDAIRNLGLTVSPEKLRSQMTVSFNPQTSVIQLSVDEPKKAEAVRITRELARVFSDRVKASFKPTATTVPGPTPGTTGTANESITATVFDPAHAEPKQVSPRPVRNVFIAFILGLVLGLLGAFLREHFDRALRSRDAVEAALGAPVIGQIPFLRGRGRERSASWGTFGEVPEAFRGLRANLQYLSVKRPLQTILVTSASAEQGKTTVAANLAIAIARSGASTIVVEGDLRRPRLNEAFGAPQQNVAGLTGVLVGAAQPDDASMRIVPPAATDADGEIEGTIMLLPSGPLPPNPAELLSSGQMRDLLEDLAGTYDYVLVDSPPLLPVADALELAGMVDGVVLVVRQNNSTTDEAREMRSLVERLGIHLIGVVMTDVPSLGSYGGYGERERERERSRQSKSDAETPRRGRSSRRQTAAARADSESAVPDDF